MEENEGEKGEWENGEGGVDLFESEEGGVVDGLWVNVLESLVGEGGI